MKSLIVLISYIASLGIFYNQEINKSPVTAQSFLIKEKSDGLYILTDYQGKELKNIYQQIGAFENNNGQWAMVQSENGYFGFIDKKGNEVVKTYYQKIFPFNEIKEGWALVKSQSGRYGFIDIKGREIVKPIYSKIYPFDQFGKGLAMVRSISGYYGFIDQKGETVVMPMFKERELETHFTQN